MKQVMHQQRTVMWTAIILIAQLAIGLAPAVGAGRVGGTGGANTTLSSAADVKVAFDEAMGKSLAERVPLLEKLEQSIDAKVFDGTLSGKDRATGLYYKYHTQLQSAKYPDVYQTYADYIKAVSESANIRQAYSTYLRDLHEWERKKDYTHMLTACQKMVEEFAANDSIKSASLYHLGLSYYHMNGTLQQCIGVCNTLIAEHLDGEWRPKAMRMLANAQFGRGNYDAALATLTLIKQQYPDTKLEHYADMRPAVIWEFGRGDPQKALSIYEATLQTYPDHMYASYIHRKIERLQGVIEKQLIQDALEGLAKKDDANAPEVDKNVAENIANDIPADGPQIGQADQPADDVQEENDSVVSVPAESEKSGPVALLD